MPRPGSIRLRTLKQRPSSRLASEILPCSSKRRIVELLATVFKGKKTEIGRFKGLGEMMASQLKETTMDPKKRTLARITVPDAETSVEDLVERLMGKRADARFQFIQENAQFVKEDLDV